MGKNNSYYLVPGSELNAIADAIRSKTGGSSIKRIDLLTQGNHQGSALIFAPPDPYPTIAIYDIAKMSLEQKGSVGDTVEITYQVDDWSEEQTATGTITSVTETWHDTDTDNPYGYYEMTLSWSGSWLDSNSTINSVVLLKTSGMAVDEMAPAIQSISTGGGAGTAIQTHQLLIFNATVIGQQNIPYVVNNELRWLSGYEEMYSHVDSGGAVCVQVPHNAIVMLRGDNHTITYGENNFIEVSNEMNLDWIGNGLHWYRMTGEVEISANW